MNDQTSPSSTGGSDLARAKRQVAAIKGFYVHLAGFTVVMLMLLLLDVGTGTGWWVHWVFLGWGIGVLAHWGAVYGRTPRFVAEWEQRKLKQLMSKSR